MLYGASWNVDLWQLNEDERDQDETSLFLVVWPKRYLQNHQDIQFVAAHNHQSRNHDWYLVMAEWTEVVLAVPTMYI